jgi:hypothetical protein
VVAWECLNAQEGRLAEAGVSVNISELLSLKMVRNETKRNETKRNETKRNAKTADFKPLFVGFVWIDLLLPRQVRDKSQGKSTVWFCQDKLRTDASENG